jgi:hypothetical protein
VDSADCGYAEKRIHQIARRWFAMDFLFEDYFDSQFDDRSIQIEAKIVELVNWVLTQ